MDRGLEPDRGYLYNLSLRAHQYVDWTEYARELAKQPTLQAAVIHADAVASGSSDVWKGEALDLQKAIIEAIEIIIAIGVDAAIERFQLPLYVDNVKDFVAMAAEKHVAGLVSGVTETTRDKIRLGIKQSLTHGETTPQAMERLKSIINNQGEGGDDRADGERERVEYRSNELRAGDRREEEEEDLGGARWCLQTVRST